MAAPDIKTDEESLAWHDMHVIKIETGSKRAAMHANSKDANTLRVRILYRAYDTRLSRDPQSNFFARFPWTF